MAKVYCPHCRSVTGMDAKGSARQLLREDRVYYKRQKTCKKCKEIITTVEVEESLVQEYDQIKKLLEEINTQIKPFVKTRLQKRLLSLSTESK
jgi:transcriptional regulator NrdR family protein